MRDKTQGWFASVPAAVALVSLTAGAQAGDISIAG